MGHRTGSGPDLTSLLECSAFRSSNVWRRITKSAVAHAFSKGGGESITARARSV